MPTQSTTYNSRVTDESLEKRFRDTFRAQGGSELVDDLYAQGVIVPVVDFTAAATGQQLAQNLQTAWDFSTAHVKAINSTETLVSNAGFWKVDLVASSEVAATVAREGEVYIDSGITTKTIWQVSNASTSNNTWVGVDSNEFYVFLRSGDSLKVRSSAVEVVIEASARQVATLSGDLVNPFGFTSS